MTPILYLFIYLSGVNLILASLFATQWILAFKIPRHETIPRNLKPVFGRYWPAQHFTTTRTEPLFFVLTPFSCYFVSRVRGWMFGKVLEMFWFVSYCLYCTDCCKPGKDLEGKKSHPVALKNASGETQTARWWYECPSIFETIGVWTLKKQAWCWCSHLTLGQRNENR